MLRPLLVALLLSGCAAAPSSEALSALPSAHATGEGLGMTFGADGALFEVQAGPTGMRFALDTPEGDTVSMGVAISDGGQQATMGLRLDAADGTHLAMGFTGGASGARLLMDVR